MLSVIDVFAEVARRDQDVFIIPLSWVTNITRHKKGGGKVTLDVADDVIDKLMSFGFSGGLVLVDKVEYSAALTSLEKGSTGPLVEPVEQFLQQSDRWWGEAKPPVGYIFSDGSVSRVYSEDAHPEGHQWVDGFDGFKQRARNAWGDVSVVEQE